MSPDFSEFVDTERLPAGEQEQLRRMHELLVAAGPPAELPAALAHAPVPPREAEVARFPSLTRRRIAGALAIAATLIVASFVGGYAIGNNGSGSGTTVRTVAMTGVNSTGSLAVGARDEAGNWPIDFEVSGLPTLTEKYAYYELLLVRHGKPDLPCGGFRVSDGTTTVHFSVPYKIKSSSSWIVTLIDRKNKWPGRTVMT
jgi:hypothetical protein